jgi:periplasmic protein TonB
MQLRKTLNYDKLASSVAVICIHIGLACLLIYGLNVNIIRYANDALKVTNIAINQPVPIVPLPHPDIEPKKVPKPRGAAAPANIISKAALREAPKPKVKLQLKNQEQTAKKLANGPDPTSGNANTLAQGTGAGGQGQGAGAGGGGNGDGGGGGLKLRSRAQYISGRIKNSDYPRAASKSNAGGVVIVKFTVSASGRISRCQISRSSGNAELDSTTCRLIEKRFRYAPARDTSGNAVDDVTGWKQDWWLENKNNRTENTNSP